MSQMGLQTTPKKTQKQSKRMQWFATLRLHGQLLATRHNSILDTYTVLGCGWIVSFNFRHFSILRGLLPDSGRGTEHPDPAASFSSSKTGFCRKQMNQFSGRLRHGQTAVASWFRVRTCARASVTAKAAFIYGPRVEAPINVLYPIR